MKKYLILIVLVMVAIVLLILKTYEIRSRYTSPRGGYNISASETITTVILAESINELIEMAEGPTVELFETNASITKFSVHSDEYERGFNDALQSIILLSLELNLKSERKTWGEMADICRDRNNVMERLNLPH